MVSRKEWGAVGGRGARDGKKHTLVIHHTVSSGTYSTLKEQKAHVRQIEAQHLGQNWSGIGYNFLVFPATKWYKRTRVFEGRGWDYIPAAQANANTGTIAIAVVGNYEVKKPGARLVGRLVHLANRAKRRKGVSKLRGHRDYMGTACPGRNLYAKLGRIRQLAGLG